MTFDIYFINLNSYQGNYSREETIRGNTVYDFNVQRSGDMVQRKNVNEVSILLNGSKTFSASVKQKAGRF